MAPITQTNHLIIRTWKRATNNPYYEWANTYEAFVATPIPDATTAGALCEAFLDAEQTIHHNGVELVRATLSSWAADAIPYNPLTFYVSEPGMVVGSRDVAGAQALPRNVVLSVRRQVEWGRAGRLFYRGVVTEADLETTSALQPGLTTTARAALGVLIGTLSASLSSALTTHGGSGSYMAMMSGAGVTPTTVRLVTGLMVRGVTFNDPDHKYFDRAP